MKHGFVFICFFLFIQSLSASHFSEAQQQAIRDAKHANTSSFVEFGLLRKKDRGNEDYVFFITLTASADADVSENISTLLKSFFDCESPRNDKWILMAQNQGLEEHLPFIRKPLKNSFLYFHYLEMDGSANWEQPIRATETALAAIYKSAATFSFFNMLNYYVQDTPHEFEPEGIYRALNWKFSDFGGVIYPQVFDQKVQSIRTELDDAIAETNPVNLSVIKLDLAVKLVGITAYTAHRALRFWFAPNAEIKSPSKQLMSLLRIKDKHHAILLIETSAKNKILDSFLDDGFELID